MASQSARAGTAAPPTLFSRTELSTNYVCWWCTIKHFQDARQNDRAPAIKEEHQENHEAKRGSQTVGSVSLLMFSDFGITFLGGLCRCRALSRSHSSLVGYPFPTHLHLWEQWLMASMSTGFPPVCHDWGQTTTSQKWTKKWLTEVNCALSLVLPFFSKVFILAFYDEATRRCRFQVEFPIQITSQIKNTIIEVLSFQYV